MTVTTPESSRDRLAIAHEAGYRRLSLVSVIAGVLAAYGAFAVIVAIVAGVLDATNVTTVRDYDWDTVGTEGAIAVAASLFLAYLFGGYVAGRMARRAGVAQGLAVFVLGIAAAVGIGLLVNAWTDTGTVTDRFRDIGIPTTRDEWSNVGTIAGIASLAAILLGSLLGGMLGDRWHTKLTARALDADYGPADRTREVPERDEALDLRDRRDDISVVRDDRDDTVAARDDRDDTAVVRGRGDAEVVGRDVESTRPLERDLDNLPRT